MSQYLSMITGASSGIGGGYARSLAERGSDLILVARRQEQLDEIAATIRKDSDGKVDTLQADLTTAADLEAVEHALNSRPVTMLVNYAGAGGLGPTAARGAADDARRMP